MSNLNLTKLFGPNQNNLNPSKTIWTVQNNVNIVIEWPPASRIITYDCIGQQFPIRINWFSNNMHIAHWTFWRSIMCKVMQKGLTTYFMNMNFTLSHILLKIVKRGTF